MTHQILEYKELVDKLETVTPSYTPKPDIDLRADIFGVDPATLDKTISAYYRLMVDHFKRASLFATVTAISLVASAFAPNDPVANGLDLTSKLSSLMVIYDSYKIMHYGFIRQGEIGLRRDMYYRPR